MLYKKITSLYRKIGFSEIFIFSLFALGLLFLVMYYSRNKTWITVDMKINGNESASYSYKNIPFWLINTVKKGDKELDGFGKPIVEVMDIKTYETTGFFMEAYVKLKIQTVYNKSQNKYTFASKDLFIGAPISVKPNGILIEGVITSIDGISTSRKFIHKKVLVQIEEEINRDITSGVPPWMGNAIKKDDEIKDFNGVVIAKVLEKKVEPAKRITTDYFGAPHLVKDPYLVDINLVMDLLVFEEKGIYYFRDTEKVKINQKISLFTKKFDIQPIIIEILD